ncbi:MAG TPA: hypothetical protein VG938_14740 [Verrucomicrobiae bacterium]|jgi:hypothetical protein|nr:hypothetical protein [Verrucomicrobiae bacterium]
MKIRLKSSSRGGYALLIVLVMAAISAMVLAGSLDRTYGVSRLNNRAVDMLNSQNAAEAALEKVFARMQYDFQSAGGLNAVSNNLGTYRGLYPGSQSGEDAFWTANFQFNDAQHNNNKTYVAYLGTLLHVTGTNLLPTSYSNRIPSALSPVYRIVSNAKPLTGSSGATGTAQEDVVLALIPLTAYAIFYNGLLEFSTCATMVVNGAVHSNTNIYVGAGGSPSTLTFNTTVTASGSVTAPPNNGSTWLTPTNYNSANWRTYFNGVSNFFNGLATVQLSIPMTNTYSLISVPTTNDSATIDGQARLFNQAEVVLTVSNVNTTDSFLSNYVVAVQIQKSPGAGAVPGADTLPTILTFSGANASPAALATNLPWLSLTNVFYDRREGTTNVTSQIDVAAYAKWLTNSSAVTAKFPVNGSSGYPEILYVNENRNTATVGGHKLDVVRLKNGIAPPSNGGAGWSVATPDPLYVWGNYNQTNASLLGKNDTTSGTVPSAFMSDALTILSPLWTDAHSLTSSYSDGGSWAADDTTVNAAILTGIVPSTGTTTTTFSGGVHNLPRLLEDWSSQKLTINTSIINLFNSESATNKFKQPGTYYEPPSRQFSYDINFMDPNKVPPGIPNALVALRYNWVIPPPNTVTYNVTP